MKTNKEQFFLKVHIVGIVHVDRISPWEVECILEQEPRG